MKSGFGRFKPRLKFIKFGHCYVNTHCLSQQPRQRMVNQKLRYKNCETQIKGENLGNLFLAQEIGKIKKDIMLRNPDQNEIDP